MKSKKILIIVIIIIAMLVIGGGIFAYLFIATDTFKSDKELFSKYMSQNLDTFKNLGNSQTFQIYKGLQDEKKYESNTQVKVVYSEGGEVSNPMNNLAAKLDIQKDEDDQYYYADGQILFNDEEYLESEIIKEKEIYGIRFSDVAKQFISIKNDTNLQKVATDIGTDTATLQKIIDILDGTNTITDEVITKDEIKDLKDKYTNMIIETILNGTFSSNKKAMITYNNNTINTKAYMVTISSEQVENLLVKILNSIKTETAITKNMKDEKITEFEKQIDEKIQDLSNEQEVPTVKITVYSQGEKAIRTVLEIGLNKIIFENYVENEEIRSDIQVTRIISEQTNEYNIEIARKVIENQEDISIALNAKEKENEYSLSLETETNITDTTIGLSAIASYKKDILTKSLKLDNVVNLKGDFDKKVKLDETNNATLNDMEEERRKNIIEVLKTNVPQKFQKRLQLLETALEIKTDVPTEEFPEYEMSQVDINKFNAKFEFYTGDEVSADNVKTMLNIVGENLGSYDIKLADGQENVDQTDEDKLKYVIRLNIERNKKDEEGIKKVLEKIKDEKKYKISISYKDQNQLIDYIVIEDIDN